MGALAGGDTKWRSWTIKNYEFILYDKLCLYEYFHYIDHGIWNKNYSVIESALSGSIDVVKEKLYVAWWSTSTRVSVHFLGLA